MKNKFFSLIASLFTLVIFTTTVNAQAPFKYLTYIFPSDSLKGFDETTYNQMAMQGGYFGPEYHVFMYSVKRQFINEKYGYKNPTTGFLKSGVGSGYGSNAKGPGNNTVLGAPCANEDFEASPLGLVTTSLTGWQLAEGQNMYLNPGGSCTMNGCCPTVPGNNAWVVNTPLVGDPVIGTIPVSPLGGTKVLKMNDDITNKGEVVRIQQTFPVTSSNALFQFAFMGALNGTGHTCCSQPYIRITLIDCMNNLIACPQVSITPPGPSCATVSATGWTTNASGYSYTSSWMVRSLDLTPYMGTCVTVQITVGDCDGWAHFGYAYVDCLCLPMTINVNNILFPAGNAAVAVAACGVSTATMTAPPGLGPYTWTGPTGTFTTQTITSTIAGNYTLTMNPIGVCAPITRTINLQFGTFPNAGFTVANTCTTYSITNTGTGPPSVQTYSFVGPGAPTSFTTTGSPSVVNFAPSTTYTILQTVTNASGCPATFSMVITTPPGPTPAFTASPSFTQCLTGNAFTFNATTTTGTHTYNFNPTVGSPAPGNTNPYGPVSFTAPGNYTVTHTVNSGGCVSSTQSVVVVNAKPTATATASAPACAFGTAILTGSGGPGNISWTGPSSFSAFGSPVSINNFTTGNQGTYTMTVNNFGCITTTTVSLTLPPWTGPVGTFTNNTNQTVTTTVAGNYTLTMNPIGVCTPITRTVNLQFGSFPNAGFTVNNTCTTYTITNTGTGPPAVQSYSFTGPGAPSSFTTTGATSVVNFGPSSTYTIYQTVTNAQNCPATFSMVINTPPGPSPAFTAAPSWTQCLSGNAFTFSASTPGGTHSYSFLPTVGAPPTGNVDPYGPVSFSAVGNYTVVHTINSAGCVSSTQSVVTINAKPTASILTAVAPPCAGAAGSLTGAGGPGLLTWAGPAGWTGVGLNASVPNWQTVNNGVYTLTVNNFGCITTTTVNLTMGSTPSATVSNSGPVCLGSPVSFSATVPASASYWYWYRPTPYYYGGYMVTSPTIAVTTATTAGTYTFYVGYTGCPVQVYTTNVVVVSAASTTISNTGPYCVGQTIQLNANAGAGATYTWSGPGGFSSTVQNPTLTASSTTLAGVYTVTAGLGACTSVKTTTVVINPLPNPIMGSNSPVCLGNNINLTTTGGGTYSWSGPNSFTSLLQNPTIVGATTAMAGVYTVTVTNVFTCKNTGTVSVTVTAPTTTAANTGPYCAGATIQLNTPAGTSYTWTGPGFSSNLQNPTIAGSTPAMSGTYSVTTSNGGCLSKATTSVTVNSLPVPAPSNTGPYCPNQTIQLNVGAFVSYTWSSTGFNSNLQNPTLPGATVSNSGSYVITVTDANGCIGTANTNVIVNPTPIVSASTSSVCENSTIILNSNGGSTYAWSGPGGFTSTLQNPTIPGATMSMNGVYTVLITSAQGCTNTAVTTATVDAIPTPVANVMGPVCVGGVLNLSGTGGTTYSWSGPNGSFGSGPSFTVFASSVSYGGTYNLTVAGPNGCSATTQVNAIVNPLPTAAIIAGNNTGCSPVCATFTVSGTGLVNAMWTMGNGAFVNGVLNTTQCYSTPGIYTVGVTATDANGCTGSNTNTVEVYPIPVADFNHAPIKPIINIDQEVTFTDASYNATIVSWNWYFMNTAQYTSVAQNPTFMYTEPGTYPVVLVVKSNHGCIDTIIRPLVVGEDYGLYVPNAFTPNADGLNDIFQPKGFGIVKYELNIFDRWGEKVFHTKTFEEGWDGTFQGRGNKIIEEGSYTWLINVTNVFGKAHELKGHVTLIK